MAQANEVDKQAAAHLIRVMLVALCAVLPLYAFDPLQLLRPTRVLGPIGIDLPAQPTQAQATKAETDASAPAPAPAPATRSAGTTLAQSPTDSTTPTGAGRPSASGQAGAPTVKPTPAPAPVSGSAVNRNLALIPIEGAEYLKPFFKALDRADRTTPVRVLHYGDSTLAGDGIAKTVRGQLKAQFGDGGPGFFVAGMDPRWMRRDDVRINRSGAWDIYTILNGGNQGRYGLGGIVAKPRDQAQVQVSPARSGQTLGRRLEVYAQKARKPDSLRIQVNGSTVAAKRIEHPSFDQWVVEQDADIVAGTVLVSEPGLELYGLVLEAPGGITWETTAVVGVSNGSFRQFNAAHLAEQTQARKPDLIVLMIGGNDASHGGILAGDGRIYRQGFERALQTLRQGSAQSACLVMSPLDQGTLGDSGRIYSKRTMERMVELQRQVSQEQGCAFWDSWSFMGGKDSFARWLDQGLAWTDLVHLTERGLNRIGQGFSRALIEAYEQQRGGR